MYDVVWCCMVICGVVCCCVVVCGGVWCVVLCDVVPRSSKVVILNITPMHDYHVALIIQIENINTTL